MWELKHHKHNTVPIKAIDIGFDNHYHHVESYYTAERRGDTDEED